MKVIPRLILGMEFSTNADRDAWVTKLKNAYATIKSGMATPTKVVISADEYILQERNPDEVITP